MGTFTKPTENRPKLINSFRILIERIKAMRVPTITTSTINIRPFIIFSFCLFFMLFLCISMISIRPNGFVLRPVARKLLGFRPRQTPKICSQLGRRESINWNYFYYYKNPASQQELIWCKVPKAGSTTLTKMFLRLAGSKHYNNNTRVHKLLRDFYPKLPNQLMMDKLKISRTFMVVRDPFERILSAYRDKLENYQRDLVFRDGYYYEHYGKFMVKPDESQKKISDGATNETATTPVMIANVTLRKEPTWKEFIQYLLKTSVARYDEHWMPITKLCSPCSVQFDYIVKMENFDEEIKPPLKSTGITAIDLTQSHVTGTANNKLVEKYFRNLTMGEVKKLYTRYKKDFLLFGYTPYKYFRMVTSKKVENSKTNKTA